jgi:hypothetical protein
MFHAKVEPTIHPAWCPCSDCKYEAERRSFRADLLVIALGIAAALAAVGFIKLFGLAG